MVLVAEEHNCFKTLLILIVLNGFSLKLLLYTDFFYYYLNNFINAISYANKYASI